MILKDYILSHFTVSVNNLYSAYFVGSTVTIEDLYLYHSMTYLAMQLPTVESANELTICWFLVSCASLFGILIYWLQLFAASFAKLFASPERSFFFDHVRCAAYTINQQWAVCNTTLLWRCISLNSGVSIVPLYRSKRFLYSFGQCTTRRLWG